MNKCRVHLFTYKRHDVLPRAVYSLLNQTFQDWVCEVHNDCPGDNFPATFVQDLNDPRFVINNHPVNLGGTVSFNLAFGSSEEKYASILEDDNWWEPNFLQDMVSILDNKPHLDVAWSNMHIWIEKPGNQWENTGKTIWPEGEDTLFTWPQCRQALGALHSNGAMLYRVKRAPGYVIPAGCEFGIIEGVRERTFNFPIYLNRQPLANFSQTLHTTRSSNHLIWTVSQVMLLGSFIMGAGDPKQAFRTELAYFRQQRPAPVTAFFLALIFVVRKPTFVFYFSLADWFVIWRWVLRHGFSLSQLKRMLKAKRAVYDFLLRNTLIQNSKIETGNSYCA